MGRSLMMSDENCSFNTLVKFKTSEVNELDQN